ncbi:MAG TPA: SANT/Myb-like DNA-binding domain-containing protein [Hyphomicrobiaceae bacterium]|nr:SANT/Myb-like DNA-binding domain-containing protein [Hyphomicrobiaceae bacterium]
MQPETMVPALAKVARKEKRSHEVERENKIQRAFAIIEASANEGRPCPTNRDLADMLGYSTPSKGVGVVNFLEAAGLIKVRRARKSRIVTIVRTGKKTAGEIDILPAANWTEDEDAILMDGIAEGASFGRVASILHKTENACTLRFHRIAAQMGEQAQ